MVTKAKIKVIKKGTQANPAIAPSAPETEKKTAQQSAREMVSIVTNWVSEFQQRRRVETKQAIEKLFSQPPQTDGI